MQPKYLYSMFEVGDAMKSLKSAGAGSPITINFANKCTIDIKIYWVNYEGQLQGYGTIPPGDNFKQSTYSGHPWLLKISDGDHPFAAYHPPLTLKNHVEVNVTVNPDFSVSVEQGDDFMPPTALLEGQSQPGSDTIIDGIIQCTTVYTEKNLHGFTVMHCPTVTQDILDGLNQDLYFIATNIPAAPLKVLQSFKLFMNTKIRFGPVADVDNLSGAVFHPSAGWLDANGNFGQMKEKCLEFYTSDDYLPRRDHFGNIKSKSAWCIVHELSHGYHLVTHGWGEGEILDCYNRAMASGKYESVPHVQGGKAKAYAANNQMEYFASLCAAYWCDNDWYPFNRQDLKEFDPEAYALVQKYYHMSKEELVQMNPDLQKLWA
jgi:hypothetical protein